MGATNYYPSGQVSEQWDDQLRWYTAFDQSGQVTSQRPYNATELASAPPTAEETARTDYDNAVNAATTLAQLQSALTAQSGYSVRVHP